MAQKTTTKPAATTRPAKSKPATSYGIADLVKATGRDAKSIRASIRRANGGAKVGKGGRYSFNASEFKALTKTLSS